MKLTKNTDGSWTCNLASLLPKAEKLSFVQLGNIMLKNAGVRLVSAAYGTTDPEWVGRYAIQFNDIQADGTLN